MSGKADEMRRELEKFKAEEALRLKLEDFFKGIEPEKLPHLSGPGVKGGGGTPHDPVQHPHHYLRFGMEVIDVIKHVLGPEGFRAYCIGNELKYRLRAGDKGDAAQDLAKAMKYREFREAE